MTGARYTEAKVSAWWKSGSAVEPSPIQLAAMRWSPLIAEAIAQPTACGNWMPRWPGNGKHNAARPEYKTGNCRHLSRAYEFEEHAHITSRMGQSRAISSPCW